jgi:hypothetical protein
MVEGAPLVTLESPLQTPISYMPLALVALVEITE